MPKNNKQTPRSFVATVYEELQPLKNSALSRSRVRIFYKGLNRNWSYITDEVADQLIASLPGTPVVGFYDADKDDFLGHIEREKNIAYGFVPQDMNFKWEMFLDPDGVYRTYACADIILWTGRYPVASKIVGKSHSMELNDKTAKGEWVETEEDFYFQFTSAEFIGLCVLGDEIEPCFEGSSFYSINKDLSSFAQIKKDLAEMISLYSSTQADNGLTGGQGMEDENKENEEVLNPQDPVNEEEETVVDEGASNEEETTPAENSGADNEEQENSEEEQEGSEETPDDNSTEETSEQEESTEELKFSQEEVEAIKADYNAQIADRDAQIASLNSELEQLRGYKAQKIDEEKDAVLENYSSKLTQEELENFKNKKSDYANAQELKKDIALCILEKEEDTDTTTASNSDYSLASNLGEQLTGAESIVARFVKNKNK
jgi:hypothetical protein